jgi:2-keto-4-pentenoate hydratase
MKLSCLGAMLTRFCSRTGGLGSKLEVSFEMIGPQTFESEILRVTTNEVGEYKAVKAESRHLSATILGQPLAGFSFLAAN